MADSIYKDVLYNNRLQTEKYINDTINLTKSLVIKNDNEAILFNKLLLTVDPSWGELIDFDDRTTWRYYKHLAGELHASDPQDIKIVSRDTGDIINFTRAELSTHELTRRELLVYGTYYSDFVRKYPDQELYIKSLINEVDMDINDIIDREDYSIISYNKDLVDDGEIDVMILLNDRIQNYRVKNLIPFYQHADSLFLAGQYVVLYNYIVTTLLGLRLKLARTPQAHSYHLQSYLSSNLRLNNEYNFLSRKQRLYLYRNVKYLANHTGMNRILHELSNVIFRERGMNLIAYDFKQISSIDSQNRPEYVFKQREVDLNSEKLSFGNYTLSDLVRREVESMPRNEREYEFTLNDISEKFHDTLYASLKTKSLESVFINDRDFTKYKIHDVVLDNIFYYAGNDLLKPLITIANPSGGGVYLLGIHDVLKFFTLVLHYYRGIDISNTIVNDESNRYVTHEDKFPDYLATRLIRSTRHSPEYYLNRMLNLEVSMVERMTEIIEDEMSYTQEFSLTRFKEKLLSIYSKELGLWLTETNEGSLYNQGNFQWLNTALHKHYLYNFGEEKPSEFIARLSLNNLHENSDTQLLSIIESTLNAITDNLFKDIDRIEGMQRALRRVFEKFKSYTINVTDTYIDIKSYPVGAKDTRMFFRNVTDTLYIEAGARVYIEGVSYEGSVDEDVTEATTAGYVQIPSTQDQLEWLMFNHHNLING